LPSLLEITEEIEPKNIDNDYDDEASPKYIGPITYKGQTVSILHTPKRLVKTLLTYLELTYYVGAAIIAPMGHGKNTFVTTLLHIIHTWEPTKEDGILKPDFNIVWAGPEEFKRQTEFYNNLPKRPTIIIYDDISGAIQQMPEGEQNKCFESLTQIRHILDPQRGKIPVMVFCIFHYSKVVPKEFRAQLPYKIYLSMGDEEQTNVKQTFDKKSRAYRKLMRFSKIYQSEMEKKKFSLRVSKNMIITYDTNKPFRVACAVTLNWTNFILYPEENCAMCAKHKPTAYVKPDTIIESVRKYHSGFGWQALREELYDQGYYEAINPKLHLARQYVRKVMAELVTDKNKLKNKIFEYTKQKRPTRHPYTKHKLIDKALTELKSKAIRKERKIIIKPEQHIVDVLTESAMSMFD